MKHRKGICFYADDLSTIEVIGRRASAPTLTDRLVFARHYITSVTGVPSVSSIFRLTKFIMCGLKVSQVVGSGNLYEITALKGDTLEEQWANFNRTVCEPPQKGHGRRDSRRDSRRAKSSNEF